MNTPENANPSNVFANLLGEGFDVSRYNSGTCQHCDRPCAVRCACGETLEQNAAHCPECGYIDHATLEPDEYNRFLMVVCALHASE